MSKILLISSAVFVLVTFAGCAAEEAAPGPLVVTVVQEGIGTITSDTVVPDPTGDEVTVTISATSGVALVAGDSVVVDPTITVVEIKAASEEEDEDGS